MPGAQRTQPTPSAIDVGMLLDVGPWTGYQIALTVLAALAIIFDGFDIQILGFAIPSIMREWHVARSAFAPIAALGLAGMAAGSPFAGYCGDRFGRRPTLIGCVLVFGLATIATAFCTSLTQLAILRVIAGAGVGGALPNASALTAEFAPLRRRAMAVTLTIICVPLGGMIAGLIAAQVLPALGWRALYMIGGAAPLLFALLLLVVLPESPGFLMRSLPARRDELIRVLRRMGQGVNAELPINAAQERRTDPRTGVVNAFRSLFDPALRQDTLGLWVAAFASMNGIYLVFGWLPAMLTARGLNIAAASSALAAYNFGGVIGVLICVVFVTVLGSRRPLLWSAAGGAAIGLMMMFATVAPAGGNTLLIAEITIEGFFANAVQTVMYALASHVYPTPVRASGVAWWAAIGRCGAMLSSLGGAWIIQIGAAAFPAVLAIAMTVAFIGMAVVRNHYPARSASAA